MKIQERKIKVRDLVESYIDSQEDGVFGLGGNLNIRPPYQREFKYLGKPRESVISTVMRGFPLNVMYWSSEEKGKFEMIDGQQRTISICQFVKNEFSVKINPADNFSRAIYFENMTKEEQESILEYEIHVFICEGNDREKLDWFEVINTAGEKLTKQELRNAVYTGEWLSNAKKYFSKTDCPAQKQYSGYLRGVAINQDYLETVLSWISDGDIEGYMSKHQQDKDAAELWEYFQEVMSWVERKFPEYRGQMKGVAWGTLYNKYKNDTQTAVQLENKIKALLADDEVGKGDNKPIKNFYEYVFSGEEKLLNLRSFSETAKEQKFLEQDGICSKCKEKFDRADLQCDHIIPWSKGGKTEYDNLQLLCKKCNGKKSDK